MKFIYEIKNKVGFNVQFIFFTLVKGIENMTLENSSIQDLIDLDNLLNNDSYTYEDWFDAIDDDDQIRKELIESINEKLTSNNYDGPNDYHTMYWFTKGLKQAGSLHAEVLDYAGAVNVAVLDAVASEGGNEVSMEQILLWDPEVVILSPEANYDEIFDDPAWADVTAVKNGAVYEAPYGPYNWMDRPPSVQRVLAIQWLGNLLYPEVFDYDMVAEAQAFYSLFFHYELTETEARELMAHSTYKEG